MALDDSPLQQAMADNGTEAGPEAWTLSAEEWLTRLAELALAFHPGEGWRYHSFSLVGILIARLTGRPLGEHLAEAWFQSAISAEKTSTVLVLPWLWVMSGANGPCSSCLTR
jgi:Beta-lactamase